MKIRYSVMSVILLLLTACSGGGESADISEKINAGNLNVNVKDAVSSSPLPGASVAVTSSDGQQIASGVTNASGTLDLSVSSGDGYTVTFTKTGYQPNIYHGVSVTPRQTKYLATVLQIDDTHTGNGTISGKIINAVTGEAISGVAVNLRSGLNNTSSGTIVKTATTDSSGNYSITALPAGNYTAEASAEGFSGGFFTITSIGNTDKADQNYTLAPVVPPGQTRIVLTWGESPTDLDSHLTGPLASGDRFHVYYDAETATGVDLDRDDTSSYGPETTTITTQLGGIYRFSVHDYTNRSDPNSAALASSGAKVTVMRGSTIVQDFHVPGSRAGTVWTVFEMNGDTIKPINTVSYSSDSTVLPMQIPYTTNAALTDVLPSK